MQHTPGARIRRVDRRTKTFLLCCCTDLAPQPSRILRQVIPTAFASFYLGELVLQ
jgi:hypothetical protein